MNLDVLKLLKAGLTDPNNRSFYLRKIQSLSQDEDAIKAEVALKDTSTTINDLPLIESGEHYKNWMKNNTKTEISESFERTQITSNMNMVSATDKEVYKDQQITPEVIKVGNEELDIDPLSVLSFIRNGEQFYDTIPNNVSNDKVMKAQKVFQTKLSEKDQKKLLDAISESVEMILNKDKKYWSLKKYIERFNKVLSEQEKIRLLSLLFKSNITNF